MYIYATQINNNIIKIFVSPETKEIIINEHFLIYNQIFNFLCFNDKKLLDNYGLIVKFFKSHKKANFLYYYDKSFDELNKIFLYFIDILNITYYNSNHILNYVDKKNILHPIQETINSIYNNLNSYKKIQNIDNMINPVSYLFNKLNSNKNIQAFKKIHKNKNNKIITLLHSLQKSYNTEWEKNLNELLEELKISSKEIFNYDTQQQQQIFNIPDILWGDYEQNLNDADKTENEYIIFVVVKNYIKKNTYIEKNKEKINLLKKNYFSEFEILTEFLLKYNKYDKIDNINNINILDLKKLCEDKNDYIIQTQKELNEIRKTKLIKDFMSKHTKISIIDTSINDLLIKFYNYLTLYYPNYCSYFNNKNFTHYLTIMGVITKRKQNGIFCRNLEIK